MDETNENDKYVPVLRRRIRKLEKALKEIKGITDFGMPLQHISRNQELQLVVNKIATEAIKD